MRNIVGSRGLAPLAVAATLLVGTGCDKAKEALKEALGVDQLTNEQQEALLVETKWHDAAGLNTSKKLDSFEILGGFTLTDKFKGDLGKSATLPTPFLSVPDQAKGASQNQGSIVLLQAKEFQLDEKTKVKKFRIIAVAKFNAADKQLEISGDTINQALAPDQRVTVSNPGSQAGSYLLVRGKGDKGLMYLNGTAMLAKADGSAKLPVKGAFIFTSESPFVTVSGPEGKYFLAMLEGSKGQVTAYKKTIPADAAGTPVSTIETIAYAGVLAGYQDKFNSKVGDVGNAEASTKAADLFTKVDTKVSDFVNGWKIISKDLVFHQPPQAAPPAAAVAAASPPKEDLPAKPAPVDPGTGTGTGTGDDPVVAPVDNTSPDVAREETPDPAYNENLGCDDPSKLVFDGSKFDSYTAATAGWRAVGDVMITAEQHANIFGSPEELHGKEPRYLDEFTGYCVLTTGDARFQLTNLATFQPVDDMSSTMWQTLKIPSAAAGYKSIQMRVAFFSQEFPKFVGTEYNDSFYIKFDEHLDNIGDGDLNKLAGGTEDATVADCKNQTGGAITCGEWQSVQKFNAKLDGELWNIDKSTTASKKLSKAYSCDVGAKGAEGKKCYPGIVPPRTFCANLAEEDMGAERTLRVAITDVGDQYFDSAIAIDSIVFSKDACGETGFSGDPKSRANEL